MDLPVLSEVKPQPAVKPPPSPVSAGVQAKAQKIEAAGNGVQTEFGKLFARAYVESILTEQFGFPVHVPDEEEAAYQRAAKASNLKRIQEQNAQDNATTAIRNVLNLPPEALKAAGFSGVTALNAEPERFAAFVNASGLSPEPLTVGDLFSIGVGTPEFGQRLIAFDPEAREAAAAAAQQQAAVKAQGDAMTMESRQLSLEAERAQQPAKIAKADEEAAKVVTQYGRGEGVYGPGRTEAVAAAEKSFDVDIGRGLDEGHGKGAAAFFTAYNAEQKRVGSRLGSPKAVAQAFAKDYAGDIKDSLEELPLDAAGNIRVGVGAGGLDPVDDDATLGLAAASMRLAKDLGHASVSDLFAQWGLKASGVDPVSFVDALLVQSAKAKPQDGIREAVGRLRDYGLLEDFGELLLSRIAGAGG